jgi:hypothetical protein
MLDVFCCGERAVNEEWKRRERNTHSDDEENGCHGNDANNGVFEPEFTVLEVKTRFCEVAEEFRLA